MSDLTHLRQQMKDFQNAEANLILEYMDEETGEIPESIFQDLGTIGHNKDVIIASAVASHNEFTELISYIDAKLERLSKLKKVYSRTSSSIKTILANNLTEGENIHSDNFMISWRKSSSILIDGFASLKDIEEKHPEAVKTTKDFNKTELKRLLKEGVKIEGVTIEEKKNLQIK